MNVKQLPGMRLPLQLARAGRRFLDGPADERDLALSHTILDGFRDLRAELAALTVEHELAMQKIERLTQAMAELQRALGGPGQPEVRGAVPVAKLPRGAARRTR